MAFYFFWKFFNRFINLLLIDLIMNLYTFIHLYKNLAFFYFGNLFRIYWQIYLQFAIQLSYLQQNSKGIYADYITLSVC